MSRLEARMDALRELGRKALVPYVCAGDPSAEATVSLMHAMVEVGADVIELGMPFSDPMADGPVIQRGSERALEAGMSLAGVLSTVARFRERDADTPVVLMGYLNPIEMMGYEVFANAAAAAGVDGVLVVDLPPEEGDPLLGALEPADLDPIFLLAPNTSAERIRAICERARGYVYYVSLKGVTGAANLDTNALVKKMAEIRRLTDLPVGVGFGIASPEAAQQVSAVADAVVVGTALVRRIEDNLAHPERINPSVCDLLGAMRRAMDGTEPAVG